MALYTLLGLSRRGLCISLVAAAYTTLVQKVLLESEQLARCRMASLQVEHGMGACNSFRSPLEIKVCVEIIFCEIYIAEFNLRSF